MTHAIISSCISVKPSSSSPWNDAERPSFIASSSIASLMHSCASAGSSSSPEPNCAANISSTSMQSTNTPASASASPSLHVGRVGVLVDLEVVVEELVLLELLHADVVDHALGDAVRLLLGRLRAAGQAGPSSSRTAALMFSLALSSSPFPQAVSVSTAAQSTAAIFFMGGLLNLRRSRAAYWPDAFPPAHDDTSFCILA